MKSNDTMLTNDKIIVGISVRTKPETAGRDISALWQRFMQEGIASQIGATDPSIYSVYCDYETDHQGAYTTVLGCEVSSSATVPAGMRRVRIPAGKYARFSVKGEPGKVVFEAWMYINGAWTLKQSRRYIADYERYLAVSPKQVEAEICVGLD